MLYPFTFHPIFKQMVWGGRNLERLYRKNLPAGVPIGESWEITDRPDAVSIIANGPLAGKDLRWLMETHQAELLGKAKSQQGRFPVLVKIIDAQQTLSLQVHPPASIAPQLGGEPKTEMWYITQATPEGSIYSGLKKGITKSQFEQQIQAGTVAECFHRLSVQAGDAAFLPSGRVHALGEGLVLFEIQQNSNTTYRVFDWNRVGLDGRPRELHVAQAMASIDFNDFEPSLLPRNSQNSASSEQVLVECEYFSTSEVRKSTGDRWNHAGSDLPVIIGLVEGTVIVRDNQLETTLKPGDFCLIPARAKDVRFETTAAVRFMKSVVF
jgi:mannose-6-phosphate isomerase